MRKILCLLAIAAFVIGVTDDVAAQSETTIEVTDFDDRAAIMETLKNFYIGDHTGSLEHKKLSMHPEGAYRYVDREGAYGESQFRLEEGGGDMNYVEELLSIEIHQTVALAKLRLAFKTTDKVEYKLVTLHKVEGKWLITTIAWGFGTIQ